MRILYISHLTIRSGSVIALYSVMKEMTRKRVEVALVVPECEGWLYEKCVKEGITVFDIGCYYHWILEKPQTDTSFQRWKGIYNYSKQILSLHIKFYRIIKQYKPDIVHCNNGTIDYAMLGCYLLKIPHVWHIREYQDLDFHFDVFPSMQFLRWKMHRNINHCIAITQGVYNHFKLKDKDIVIYDGVINEPVPVRVPNREYDFPYLLFTGTICEGKGVHILIEQYAKFHQVNPNVHLIVAGFMFEGDEYSEKCKMMVKERNLNGYVHFIGHCEDIYSLMTFAKALVVPSYFEGFGFVTVEAMYNHCLVIGRNTAGTKEQFDVGKALRGEEIGLRFDREEELPLLMQKAVSEDFSDMKQRAWEVVVNNYTTKINSDKIYNYYQTILHNKD